MTARTHDLAALNALAVVVLVNTGSHTITLSTLFIALLANQIGGIVPDIDQPTAPFWRNLPIGGFFGRFVDKMLGGHRFLTHSLLGVGLFAFLSNLLLHFLQPIMQSVDIRIVWWAFIVGMVSHLIMDTFTKEGVPWFLPLPIKFGIPPVRAFRITTGKNAERFIFLFLLCVDLWYGASHYDHLLHLFHTRIV
jgi:inner membrane protein